MRSILFLLFLFCNLVSIKAADALSLKLKKIKQEYASINSYKNYKKIICEDADNFLGFSTDNGATLTGYFMQDSIFKIVSWVGLSNKVVQREYYFSKAKLIFVFEKISFYKYNNQQQTFDYSVLIQKYANRFYIEGDKLIYQKTEEKKSALEIKGMIEDSYSFYSFLQKIQTQ